jgi:hypothetical protein
VRNRFSRYSDLIFIGAILGAFAVAGVLVLSQSMISMEGWETDMSTREVPLSDFKQLGDREDFPPINEPVFAAPGDVDWLGKKSPVIALITQDEARAYPLAILLYHQVVNDTFQTLPIAVTYCALCNSTIVFDRRVGEDTLRFAASGSVRNSGTVMWDDRTESWWQQFTGKAIMGAYTGEALTIVPSQVVSFGVFKMHYPDGQVLVGDKHLPRYDYGTSTLANYDSQSQPMFYNGEVDPRLPAMERVLAAVIAEQPIAYPFSVLAQENVVNDTVNATPVVVFWQPGVVSTVDALSIAESRDVGMAVMFSPVVNGQRLTFYGKKGSFYDKETHTTWNIFGKATQGALEGKQLQALPCYPHFWFAWAVTYPETIMYPHTDD